MAVPNDRRDHRPDRTILHRLSCRHKRHRVRGGSGKTELLTLPIPAWIELDVGGETLGREGWWLASLDDRLGDVRGEKAEAEHAGEVRGAEAGLGVEILDAFRLGDRGQAMLPELQDDLFPPCFDPEDQVLEHGDLRRSIEVAPAFGEARGASNDSPTVIDAGNHVLDRVMDLGVAGKERSEPLLGQLLQIACGDASSLAR